MDNRIGGWRIISISKTVEHHTLMEMATIFIERNSEYFYISDEFDKIEDVTRMPIYISEDWVKYNSKELTTKMIDNQILIFKTQNYDLFKDVISELLSVRREIIIKKII